MTLIIGIITSLKIVGELTTLWVYQVT